MNQLQAQAITEPKDKDEAQFGEMQIHSNYRGWNHSDAGDFKKRVEDSLAKLKGSKPAEPAKPADAPK